MKNRKFLMLAVSVFASANLLAACGSRQGQSSGQSSSAGNSQSVQASASASQSGQSAPKAPAGNSTVQEPAAPAEEQGSEATSQSQPEPSAAPAASDEAPVPAASGIDVNALAKGDFSSVAGTWQDDLGNVLVLDKNGVVSHTLNGRTSSDFSLVKGQAIEGCYVATLAYTAGYTSATFVLIPEGAALPDNGAENPRTHIRIGHDSITATMHPYYRVSE